MKADVDDYAEVLQFENLYADFHPSLGRTARGNELQFGELAHRGLVEAIFDKYIGIFQRLLLLRLYFLSRLAGAERGSKTL